jgi:hypothetical protein
VSRVMTGPRAVERIDSRVGELEGVIEFAVCQQAGVAGCFGAVEFEAEAAVELGSERLGLAVTHQRTLSNWQECAEDSGKHGVQAQLSCRDHGLIWEIPEKNLSEIARIILLTEVAYWGARNGTETNSGGQNFPLGRSPCSGAAAPCSRGNFTA